MSLDEFDQIMQYGAKVSQLKPLADKQYKAFLTKKGEEVRLVSVQKHLEYLPRITYLYPFFQTNKLFWLIPCMTPGGRPYGYIMRSFDKKEYRVFANQDSVQLLYGWEQFNNKFRPGLPIILTEGAKDAMFIQTIYPYTLAFLSSDITQDTLNYLGKLRPSIILALDNDKSGEAHRKRLRAELTARKIRVSEIVPKTKDFGDYFENPAYFERYFKVQLQTAMLKLGENYNGS